MPFVRDDEFFIKIHYPKSHKIVKVRSIGKTDAATAVEWIAQKNRFKLLLFVQNFKH
ncbi:MAG: hypothetical protein HC789_03775 [Microcoleus sp. CSU_2_2]|nr:hypothetical protein [Microcoleus sp. CSU_2_2]